MASALYLHLIYPLEVLMRGGLEEVYFSTHSYGLAIIVLSVSVSFLTLPLYAIAERWQEEERKVKASLSPGLRHIKRAFRGQERFFMIRTLYRQHAYHPIMGLRSSLGLLIQVPFFVAAYHFIGHYQPLDGVSFLWFENLAMPDRLLDLGDRSINLMPFVMTGVNIASAHVYGQALERRETVQLYLLAAVFLVLLYNSPVALVLYWTINNVFSFGKNLIARRAESAPALSRLGAAIGGITLPPIGLAAVAVVLLASAVLAEAAVLPQTLGTPAAFGSAGLLLYLSVVAAGAFIRSFSPTPFALLCAFVSIAAFAVAVLGVVEVLGSGQYEFALEQQRNRIWVALAVVIGVTQMARFSLPTGKPLLEVEGPARLFFLSSSLIVVVICIFSPLSLFLSDPEEFSIGMLDALLGASLIGLVAMVVLSVTYYMTIERLRGVYAFVMSSAAIVVCLYTFILVGDYGSIDFFTLDDQSFMTPALFAIDLLVVFTVGAIVFHALRKRHCRTVCQLLTILLSTTLLVSGYQLHAAEGDPLDEGHFDSREGLAGLAPLPDYNKDLLNFSRREKNIVVLMLDAFNAYTLPVSLEREPTLRDDLDGFVWYRNALSAGYVTALGEPGIHGGHHYTPTEIRKREYATLIEESTQGYRVFSDSFGDEGFDVSYAGVQHARCDSIDEVSRVRPVVCVGNRYGNDYATSVAWPGKAATSMLNGTAGDSDGADQQRVLVAISVFRAVPFSLKEAVYDDGRWLGAYPLARKNVDEAKNAARDLVGLYALSQVGDVSSTRATFKYIQNNSTHRPFYIDTQTCLPALSQSNDEVARDCALRYIVQWIEWLKDKGIYDNTMIVLVSDHGPRRRFGSRLGVPLTRTNALLMVKDFGESGALRVSDVFMSNADVPAIVCTAIGGCAGVGDDPRGGGAPRTLYFVKGNNKQNDHRISEENVIYRVEDDIFDPDNWSIVR